MHGKHLTKKFAIDADELERDIAAREHGANGLVQGRSPVADGEEDRDVGSHSSEGWRSPWGLVKGRRQPA